MTKLHSIAVPRQDRSYTDDKRIFGHITKVYKDNYTIQTKHGILDCQYPTSQLVLLSANIDIDFPDPPVLKKITLHYAAAQENTSENYLSIIADAKINNLGVVLEDVHVLKLAALMVAAYARISLLLRLKRTKG